ncbi:hypothetical protein B0H17DRAFT_704464 [Mycena rosella]|uniref:Uncharacterized protein n=1 Tax=Mycena rosella TaxID=1033263 RepID=A0AAD7DAD4_MYCRO|nr:hypothetical protein B0H17DRAFT_704464 [Mycena rosella]
MSFFLSRAVRCCRPHQRRYYRSLDCHTRLNCAFTTLSPTISTCPSASILLCCTASGANSAWRSFLGPATCTSILDLPLKVANVQHSCSISTSFAICTRLQEPSRSRLYGSLRRVDAVRCTTCAMSRSSVTYFGLDRPRSTRPSLDKPTGRPRTRTQVEATHANENALTVLVYLTVLCLNMRAVPILFCDADNASAMNESNRSAVQKRQAGQTGTSNAPPASKWGNCRFQRKSH